MAGAGRWAGALSLCLTACASPSPVSRSDRVVSTNPCLDAILVELVPPGRIAAISHYSHDPRATSMPVAQARRLPATSGTAEEVIALRPGLVLASSFTPPATLAAYRRMGLKVAVYGSATTIADNRAQIRDIARAVGAPERGEALIARIDRAIADAAPPDPARPAALLWLGASNMVSGRDTLIDEMMRIAGFRNASADYGMRNTGVLPLEQVVAHPPQVVLTPEAEPGVDEDARRVSLRMHAIGGRATVGAFPPNLFYCGGPSIIPAMQRLAALRRQLRT